MNVILYTTHCPQCNVLTKKLEQKNIEFNIVDDVNVLLSLGISAAPALSVNGGEIMNFKQAVAWLNSLEV